MSLTKAQLEALNESSFPNNNEGLITPEILRNYNSESIDNTVNQADYTADSASFDTRINNIVVGTGFATTGSNTFYGDQYYNANLHVSGTNYIDFNGGLLRIGEVNNGVTLVDAYDGIQIRNFTSNDIDIEQNANASINIDNNSGSIQINTHTIGQSVSISASYLQLNNVDFIPFSASVNSRINAITGSTIQTGSFATTGSNQFVGNQIINGDVRISGSNTNQLFFNRAGGSDILRIGVSQNGNTFEIGLTGSVNETMWLIDNQGGTRYNTFDKGVIIASNNSLNVTGPLTASLQQGYAWVGNASNVSTLVPTSSFSGASINTASFATTGSNTFYGGQIIADGGGITFNATTNDATGSGRIQFGNDPSLDSYIQSLDEDGSGKNRGLQLQAGVSGSFRMRALNAGNGGVAVLEAYNKWPSPDNGAFFKANGNGNAAISASQILTINQFTWPAADGTNGQVLTTNGSGVLSFTTASVDLTSLNSFTASQYISNSYFATTGSNNFVGVETINSLPGTGSGEVYLLAYSGSLVLGNSTSTASYAALSHLTASSTNSNTNLIFKTNSNSSSLYINSKNSIFANPSATATDYKRFINGDGNIFLNPVNIPYVTGSGTITPPTTEGNIITNLSTASFELGLISSGNRQFSGNALMGSSNMRINWVGNGSLSNTIRGNQLLNGIVNINAPSRSIAEINTPGYPYYGQGFVLSANTIAGTFTFNGPVSASNAPNIQLNNIGGTVTLNAQSSSKGINFGQNVVAGTINFNDNTADYGLMAGAQHVITNNNINGVITVNQRYSGSYTIQNNTIGGTGQIISTDLDLSAVTTNANRVTVLANDLIYGINQNIYFSGSQGAVATPRHFSNNVMGGLNNSASLAGDGTSKNIFGTAIIGQGLFVSGGAILAGAGQFEAGGSAFFGRWNSQDGTKSTTGYTVFAIGTGVSGSAGITRKTGFLIDSGSNTFIEGTLNVSGSTTITGSTFISGALNTTGSITIQSGSGDLYVHGNKQFNVGAFQTNVSQSGSANVSQSVNFEVTDISHGVSIVSNSQITIANSGVYSITFSAQADPSSGAGDLYMWLKKNGSNVAESASKLSLANNQAQLMTVNFVVEAAANDYYEIAWQSDSGDIVLLAAAATGNIPAIPAVIATVTQVR